MGGVTCLGMCQVSVSEVFSVFLNWTPCLDWTMCPLIFSSADRQYYVELARVSPGQVR